MLRVYAIGDIHGSLRALCRLITECERDADGRPMRLVFIGDYIDRGPDSRGVVEYIMNLQSRLAANAICLMGNHEALALSAIDDLNTENWIFNGGDMTLRSYDVSSAPELPAAHVGWLRSLRLAFDDGLRFFVHAGINPAKPLDRQDRHDLLWIREPFLSMQQDYGRLIVHGQYADQNWVAGTERKSSKYRYWCRLWWSLNGSRFCQRTEKSSLIYPGYRTRRVGAK